MEEKKLEIDEEKARKEDDRIKSEMEKSRIEIDLMVRNLAIKEEKYKNDIVMLNDLEKKYRDFGKSNTNKKYNLMTQKLVKKNF